MSKFSEAETLLKKTLTDTSAKSTLNKISSYDVTNTEIARKSKISPINLLENGEDTTDSTNEAEENIIETALNIDNPYSLQTTGSLYRRGLSRYTEFGQLVEDLMDTGDTFWSNIDEDSNWWDYTTSAVNAGLTTASTLIQNSIASVASYGYELTDYLENNTDSLGIASGLSGGISTLLNSVLNGATTISKTALGGYNDGVTETVFGTRQESSWYVFVNGITAGNINYKINVINNTPLNSKNSGLYGSMILGAPFTFNERTDPLNRVMIQTFVKDKMFLSLTPGLPKYNGSRYEATTSNDITQQTLTANEMLDYLIQNGTNATNLAKDKRYYVFSPSYGKYFSYLETALNTIYIKMGLATNGDGGFNLLTFFDGLDTSSDADPLEQYKGALGFFVNPSGGVAENLSNTKTSLGLADEANSNSDEWQKLNAIMGMGTSNRKNLARTIAGASWTVEKIKDTASNLFSNTVSGWNQGSGIKDVKSWLGAGTGLLKDSYTAASTDVGSTIQQFAMSNGMKVMYPELWSNSDYSKSMTFDFNFVSPVGDPEAIFRYVYVPFMALMCLVMPRQADDNGFVSPFFVRADLPGIISSDFAFISNISYTKGGAQNLFTKDGLPRAISGSFTIEDLYPFLAMSRRISFLSANPSYTSFLDSMVGINASYTDNNESALNDYFDKLINRANGKFTNKGLWNGYSKEGRVAHTTNAASTPANKMTQLPRSINWMRKV